MRACAAGNRGITLGVVVIASVKDARYELNRHHAHGMLDAAQRRHVLTVPLGLASPVPDHVFEFVEVAQNGLDRWHSSHTRRILSDHRLAGPDDSASLRR